MTSADTRPGTGTTAGPGAGAGRGTTPRASSPGTRRAVIGVLLATLVVGFALGRFLFLPAPNDTAPPALDDSLANTITELESTVAANPNDLAAWQRLGATYTRRAVELGDPSFYALAERAFDEADALLADDPSTLVGRGALALSLHEFDRALTLGQRGVEGLPNNADALGVVVDAQVELGQYDAAAETLQEMLDVRPGLPALARTSYLRELHGELSSAVTAMRQAEVAGAASPFDVATVAALLGDLAFEAGDLDTAAAAYQRADDAASGIVPAQVGAARLLAARGDLSAAIVELEPVVARYPQPAAVQLLGELHAAAGDAAAAAEQFEVVRAIAALQAEAGQIVDLEMALFEADHGDPAEAVRLAEAAHAARPDNIFADDALAWALLADGRADEALPHARDAVRLDTADTSLRFHAAAVMAAAGEVDDARAQLEAAFALNPAFSVVHAEAARQLATDLGIAVPAALAAP